MLLPLCKILGLSVFGRRASESFVVTAPIMRPGRLRSNGACCLLPAAWALHSAHERLALDVVRFLIALLGAQRIGEQSPGLLLCAVIAARDRERFPGAAFRLAGLAFQEPQSPDFYPQQRIIRLDAQRAIERRRRTVNIAVRRQGSRLIHERESGGREVILARRRGQMRWWRAGG